jgi:hypothetical protein
LRLADLGFHDLNVIAALDASGAFFLSKLPVDARVSQSVGRSHSLPEFIQALGPCAQWQGRASLGEDHRVQARLLVQAVPQEMADQR